MAATVNVGMGWNTLFKHVQKLSVFPCLIQVSSNLLTQVCLPVGDLSREY